MGRQGRPGAENDDAPCNCWGRKKVTVNGENPQQNGLDAQVDGKFKHFLMGKLMIKREME